MIDLEKYRNPESSSTIMKIMSECLQILFLVMTVNSNAHSSISGPSSEYQATHLKDNHCHYKQYGQMVSTDETIRDDLNKRYGYKDVCSTIRGHLETFGESGSRSQIAESSGFPSSFFQDHLLVSKPILMKGAAKMSPAYSKWNDHYLKHLATRPVNADMILQVETVKKENRQEEIKEMGLAEFLDVYNNSDLYVVNEVPFYMESDLVMPCPLQHPDAETIPMSRLMWFSSGDTKSVVHTDSYDNINCLFRGNKTVILLDPASVSIGGIIDHPEGTYSNLDVDQVDLYRYHALRDKLFWVAEMEAGDCLYIPYLWIHQVRSFGSNLAVNIWMDHYVTLDVIQSNSFMPGDAVCDPTSTLDLWLNPSLESNTAPTDASIEAGKDIIRILFEYAAYHVDRLTEFNAKTKNVIEKVKVDTLIDSLELYMLSNIELNKLSDNIPDSRQELIKAIHTMDEDKDGILSKIEFNNNNDVIWEIIKEMILDFY